MKTRDRKEEKSVPLEYLRQIHDVHEEWLYHQTLFSLPAPVIIIDGNKDFDGMVEEFETCRKQIFGENLNNFNPLLMSTQCKSTDIKTTSGSDEIKTKIFT